MTKKKQDPTRRNFFKIVAIIGFAFIAGIGYKFISAAPKLSLVEFHEDKTVTQCLNCHTQNIENTPIMPHRPIGSCTFCHTSAELPKP